MSDDPRPIKRCVCFNKTFKDLKDSGLETVEQIASEYGCTTGCGLCREYIRRMLETGEVEFEIEG